MKQSYVVVILCLDDEQVFNNCSQAAKYAGVSRQAMYAGMKKAKGGKWICGGKEWVRVAFYPSFFEEVSDNV